MTTKAKKSTPAKKQTARESTGKPEKKLSVKTAALEETANANASGNSTTDEGDENEDAEDAASESSAAGSGNAAAIAAASGNTEMSASFKNFRHHPDMENFYRFIFDNDLRHEALQIIDEMLREKQQRKALKFAKTRAH